MKKRLIILAFGLLGIHASCKKLLQIEPPKNQLTTVKVFRDTTGALSALLNIYIVLENQQIPASNKFLSVYTDESLSTNSETWNQSRVTPADINNKSNWDNLYNAIYQCNMILEQTSGQATLPSAFTQRIQNEARFLRSYCYFNLVSIYGKVPLILSTEVNLNKIALQNDSADVYSQILADLTTAHEQLPVAYQGAGKVRANRACAKALLARVYLYQRNWAMAEQMAAELINSGTYTPLDIPGNVFKSSARESILQLSTQTGFASEAPSLIPTSATAIPGYFFTDQFYKSFESTDLRKTVWIAKNTVTANGVSTEYFYPAKYKNRVANTTVPENHVLLRIAEQYLIRAEARAWQGKIQGAESAAFDINTIRSRAGLTAVHPTDKTQALEFIYEERRHELFFENSDRFLDLKRTGRLDAVIGASKTTWLKSSALLPIPAAELIRNSKLIQNDGY